MWMAFHLNKNLSSLFSLLACRMFNKCKYNWVRMVIIFFDEKSENPKR